jgi:hypothetical protein
VIARISYIHPSRGADRHAKRKLKARLLETAIQVPPAFEPAGKGRALPIGANLPDNGVDVIGDVPGARRCDRYAGGGVEARRLGQPFGKALLARGRDTAQI